MNTSTKEISNRICTIPIHFPWFVWKRITVFSRLHKTKMMPCAVVSAQPWGTFQIYSLAEWWYAHCRESAKKAVWRSSEEYLRPENHITPTLLLWSLEQCYTSLLQNCYSWLISISKYEVGVFYTVWVSWEVNTVTPEWISAVPHHRCVNLTCYPVEYNTTNTKG